MTALTAVTLPAHADDPARPELGGVLAVRLDGRGRGAAAEVGGVIEPEPHLALELAVLRSSTWGSYVGAHVRFITGTWSPYAGLGLPVFFFTDDAGGSRAVVGGHFAAGAQVAVMPRLTVYAELAGEHFFGLENVTYHQQPIDATLFVPSLGVIGTL